MRMRFEESERIQRNTQHLIDAISTAVKAVSGSELIRGHLRACDDLDKKDILKKSQMITEQLTLLQEEIAVDLAKKIHWLLIEEPALQAKPKQEDNES
jgi:hypothetical protein